MVRPVKAKKENSGGVNLGLKAQMYLTAEADKLIVQIRRNLALLGNSQITIY